MTIRNRVVWMLCAFGLMGVAGDAFAMAPAKKEETKKEAPLSAGPATGDQITPVDPDDLKKKGKTAPLPGHPAPLR